MIHNALVVDDSRTARFMLAQILQRLGVVTATANSAEEALAYLDDHVPDAIFIDHVMPGIDGLDATRRIKRDPRFAVTPIVIFTANEGDDYIEQARAHGAHSVLTKPPSDDFVAGLLEELAAEIARATALPDQPAQAAAEIAAAPGLAEEEVEQIARRIVDDAFGARVEARVGELLDARIGTLRDELREQHSDDDARLADLAGQAREALAHDSATAEHADRLDAQLEATAARLDALQQDVLSAGKAATAVGARLDWVESDDVEPLATRIEAMERKQADLAGRTAELIEKTVEKTSRRYARGVAHAVRKDAAAVTAKLVDRHVARLRDELVAAREASSEPPPEPASRTAGGKATAVAVLALLIALGALAVALL